MAAVERPRVLLVEDDPQVGASMELLLSELFRVELADSVRDATQRIGERAFDVVLSDVVMPLMTGLELYRWVLAEHPRLVSRFAFVTGGIADPGLARAVEASGRPVLLKPFKARALLSLVHRLSGAVADEG